MKLRKLWGHEGSIGLVERASMTALCSTDSATGTRHTRSRNASISSRPSTGRMAPVLGTVVVPDDFKLFVQVGIFDVQGKHKPVLLCLGQGIRAFLLDGVLRGQDPKRTGQGKSQARGSHFAFLHGLEQGGLGFGRCAVYFVGKHDVRENRALDEFEFAQAACLVVEKDFGSRDIGGHKIGRELDAVEFEC